MRRLLLSPLLASALACRVPEPGTPAGTLPDDTGAPVLADTTAADTGTDAPDPCGTDPDLSLELSAAEGVLPTQLSLTVSVDRAAAVVARCVAGSDPEEVHFVASATPATTHPLVFSGLLPDTSYTCAVAATCPATAAAATLDWTTAAAPSFLLDNEVEVDPALGATPGYTLTNWKASDCAPEVSPAHWMMAWDPRGRLRWWWPILGMGGIGTEVHLHPTEPWIGWGGGGWAGGFPRYLDPTAGPAYEASAFSALPESEFSHDMRTLPDGRILTLEYLPNRRGGDDWDGFAVRLWDPTRELVTFELDSQELVDDGVLPVPVPGTEYAHDPYHANALDWVDGADPELLVSMCYAHQVMAYDVNGREPAWILGAGLGWTVLDEAGAPLGDEALPQCTHGVEWDGARLLVYDNGRVRGHSSASEWAIDPQTLTARRTWSWTEPGWFRPIMGDVEDLSNGRVLITKGENACGVANESLEVVRATGEVAARTTFPPGAIYRSEHVDGCRLFTSTRECPALAEQLAAVEPLLDR